MRIINLKGENFKRMVAFDITPKGNTVVVSGKNGQGKSSVLDAIALAIEGKTGNVGKLTTKPVRDGERIATVEITTDEFVISRKWVTQEDGSYNDYLEITSADGLKYPSPQTVLNKLVGDLCFDPLEFARLKEKDQREELLSIVKLDINLAEWEEVYKEKYEERKMISARAKEAKVLLSSRPRPADDTPDEEVSIAALAGEMKTAEEHNQAFRQHLSTIGNCNEKIEIINEEMVRLQESLKKVKEFKDEEQAKLDALGKEIDTSEIQKNIMTAEQTNQEVRAQKEFRRLERESADAEEKREKAEKELQDLIEDRTLALSSAQFPIAGLGVEDDGVMFKGVPFAQCSDAEKLKISMAIAMAANPKLRVIRITDGSLLDEDNMKVLEEMADKNDYQVWIERVDSSGKVGIIIEDGHVVASSEA